MKQYSRKDFLHNTAGLLALALGGSAFEGGNIKPLLSFSTLGCPDWTFKQIVSFAQQNGYQGVEIRVIERKLDLPNTELFNTPQKIIATKKFVKENGIKIVNLGASSALHYSDVTERKKNLDEAKQFIDLAAHLKCPYIRVFPNDFPANRDRNATIDLIVRGLLELGDYAKGTGVTVLMESHGQVVKTSDLETIMLACEHKHIGLIWDIVNMWSVTKEPPAEVYQKLKKYIRHTHIKDLKVVNGKEKYTLLGKGETPVFEGIDALKQGGYKGYFSFEWEKMWHPEIDEPEIALAHYSKTMNEHFKKG